MSFNAILKDHSAKLSYVMNSFPMCPNVSVAQVSTYMINGDIYEPLHSAYHTLHATKSAFLMSLITCLLLLITKLIYLYQPVGHIWSCNRLV